MERQQAREVEVHEDVLHIDDVGGRLRYVNLSEAQVEQGREVHAADGDLQPRLLLQVGCQTVHCPPLHGRQVETGDKQHKEQ